jgi:hypothetical protein
MSRKINRVHFFPRTPRLVLMGQFLNITEGSNGFSERISGIVIYQRRSIFMQYWKEILGRTGNSSIFIA